MLCTCTCGINFIAMGCVSCDVFLYINQPQVVIAGLLTILAEAGWMPSTGWCDGGQQARSAVVRHAPTTPPKQAACRLQGAARRQHCSWHHACGCAASLDIRAASCCIPFVCDTDATAPAAAPAPRARLQLALKRNAHRRLSITSGEMLPTASFAGERAGVQRSHCVSPAHAKSTTSECELWRLQCASLALQNANHLIKVAAALRRQNAIYSCAYSSTACQLSFVMSSTLTQSQAAAGS